MSTESSDTYTSITTATEGQYKEKGSKFIALAYPVSTLEQVKAQLAQLRKTYYDARHHCYAYILGQDGAQWRANDDGEPNHSAGDPILGQIRSRQISDVLVVVVRYFGGTKLGVSGLINAYRTAAATALDEATFKEIMVTEQVTIRFQYPAMNAVMKIVKDFDLEIIEQIFALDCKLQLSVRQSILEQIKSSLQQLDSVTVL